MGTDLFTSSRGPGVIGTLMALVVLIGFGVLYLFVFDERFQGGGQTIESIIAGDAKQIAHLGERVADKNAKLETTKEFKKTAGQLQDETTRHTILVAEREKFEATAAEAAEAIKQLKTATADYKQAYRKSARASMVDREMDSLKTTDGKTFENVKIADIDPVRMQIRHRGGITGVALEVLPEEMQDYLQFDPEEKNRHLAVEQEVREKSAAGAAQGDLLKRINDLRYKLEVLTRKRDEAARNAERAQSAVPNLKLAIDAKKQELQREKNKSINGGISNAPQVRVQLTKLEQQLEKAIEQGPALQLAVQDFDQQIAGVEEEIREARAELDKNRSESSDPE